MRKIIMLVCSIYMVFTQSILGQIGINTEYPEHILHIDPAKNNDINPTDPASKLDDVVFTSQGNIGIGTANPDEDKKIEIIGNLKVRGKTLPQESITIEGNATTKQIGIGTDNPEADLHIVNNNNNVSIKISDGSEKSGYILTSDQEGRVYWDGLRPMSSVVFGSLRAGVVIPNDEKPHSITQDTLSLAPGRWLVIAKSAIAGNNLGGFNMYMDLIAENGFNGNYTTVPNSGITIATSASSGETAGAMASAPNIVYVLSVPVKNDDNILPGTDVYNTKFWVALRSSRASTTNSDYGEMQFYAIRIDRPD